MTEYKSLKYIREQFRKLLTTDNICKYITDIKIMNNDTESFSILMYATLVFPKTSFDSEASSKTSFGTNIPIVIKSSFEPIQAYDNALLVESQIYEYIISELLQHTPYLVRYIGTIPTKYNINISDNTSTYRDKLDYINNLDIYNMKSKFHMIIEETDGLTFDGYLEKYRLNTEDGLIILFQIIYTLLCFKKIGLVHNDLHGNNIFIDILEEESEYSFEIDKNQYVNVKTRLHCRIFDFNTSSIDHDKITRNIYNDYEYMKNKHTYQSNKKDFVYDIQGILSNVYDNEDIPELILDFISRHVNVKNIANRKHNHIPKDKYELNDKYSDIDKVMEDFIHMLDTSIESAAICVSEEPMYFTYNLPSVRSIQMVRPQLVPGPESKKNPIIFQEFNYNKYFKHYTKKTINKHMLNVYQDEYPGYDILDNAKKLLVALVELKSIQKSREYDYIEHCILLSLPFFYRLLEYEKRDVAKLLKIQYNKDIENNIYNTFKNILPIYVPRYD